MTRAPTHNPAIRIRPITRNDWPLIERLFGECGTSGGCWCMWPRVPGGVKPWQECKGERNPQSFKRFRAGIVSAVMGGR